MHIEHIQIVRLDQVKLQASLYKPQDFKGAVMIAPATGIKRGFYNSFATFLAQNGFGVITFDNEGIGDSLSGLLKKSNASLVTWGQEDMTAVFAQLKSTFPNTSYHLLGHSAGGQLVGLMQGALELRSIFNVACSSGSIQHMRYPFKAQAYFFMNVFIPLSNIILGYADSPKLGMGEALPKEVSQQWADWCNSTGYIQDYLTEYKPKHYFHSLACPSMWVYAEDDPIANLTNLKDMTRVFPSLPTTIVSLNPKDYKYKDIGHMKFFSKRRKDLWSMALNWLNEHAKV